MISFFRSLFILLLLFSSHFACGDNVFSYSKHEVIAHRVSADVAKTLSKRYQMELVGFGGAIHEDVEKLSLSFNCYRTMNMAEYRNLIVQSAEFFLSEVNSNEELKPFLHNYPFDSNHIDLAIYVFSEDRQRLKVGQLSCVHLIKGKISYSIRDTEHTVKPMQAEDYESAKQLVLEIANKGDGPI